MINMASPNDRDSIFVHKEESYRRKVNTFKRRNTEDGWNWMENEGYRISNSQKNDAEMFCDKEFGDNWIWSTSAYSDWTELYFINREDELICRLRFPAYTD